MSTPVPDGFKRVEWDSSNSTSAARDELIDGLTDSDVVTARWVTDGDCHEAVLTGTTRVTSIGGRRSIQFLNAHYYLEDADLISAVVVDGPVWATCRAVIADGRRILLRTRDGGWIDGEGGDYRNAGNVLATFDDIRPLVDEHGTVIVPGNEVKPVRSEHAKVAEVVRALHHPVEVEPSAIICAECSHRIGAGPAARYLPAVEWPCSTVAALNVLDGAR